jgi:hypothetical protein
MARRRFHRVVFILAGGYNLAWGMYAVLDPQWLFRFAGLPLQNYPQIFACLGMVVGLYGILYLEVARLPERGWLLAAVGLLGKVLGPLGLAQLIWSGQWPWSTVVLCSPMTASGGYLLHCISMMPGLPASKPPLNTRYDSQPEPPLLPVP